MGCLSVSFGDKLLGMRDAAVMQGLLFASSSGAAADVNNSAGPGGGSERVSECQLHHSTEVFLLFYPTFGPSRLSGL